MSETRKPRKKRPLDVLGEALLVQRILEQELAGNRYAADAIRGAYTTSDLSSLAGADEEFWLLHDEVEDDFDEPFDGGTFFAVSSDGPEDESEASPPAEAKPPRKRRPRKARMPVIPLRNSLLFPHQVIPLSVGRERSIRAIEAAMEGRKRVLVVAQIDPRVESPGAADIHHWGTVAQVLKVFEMPDGTRNVIIQGLRRAQLVELEATDPHLTAMVLPRRDELEESIEVEAMVTNLRNLVDQAIDLAPYLTSDHFAMVSSVTDPGNFCDAVISVLNLPVAEKQPILEDLDVRTRLEQVTGIITRELQKLELGSRIQSEVQGEISRSQRDYFLREQMKAIQRELGDEDGGDEIKELREGIQKSKMPAAVRKQANKDLDRLARIHPGSPEYTVARTYLDVLLELPWKKYTRDRLDIGKAGDVLDRDHHGLVKVKKRILEFLAVRKLKKDMRGPILCFVGPPGVGKTSLGRSIADALGRKFHRISLGGVHDEAEVRGHRRTYIGAMPGRILQGLKRAGTANPVFMLDEIDKLGADFRGDPSSALLEVLDPEQNHAFSDHYVDLPFDLSRVMFIATANVVDTIPAPLRDRMEVIELPGYTLEEKVRIARDFLLPKQTFDHGLTEKHITVSDDTIRKVIENHTREAGVRNLERSIGSVCRGVARAVAEESVKHVEVDLDDLPTYLGQPRYFPEVAERVNRPGIATGLAWTPTGGDLLFVEATRMAGKGKLILSGRLGEVMQESAGAALSLIRSRAKDLGVDADLHENWDIHVHVPAGAIPKDGPSAGVTMVVTLMSLLSGQLVRSDTAMTGEITLRGAVLPVGGIKEKLLAAHRGGIRRIILPEKNRRDIEDLPEDVRSDLEFHFVSDVDEVLPLAIEMPRQKSRRKPRRSGGTPPISSIPTA